MGAVVIDRKYSKAFKVRYFSGYFGPHLSITRYGNGMCNKSWILLKAQCVSLQPSTSWCFIEDVCTKWLFILYTWVGPRFRHAGSCGFIMCWLFPHSHLLIISCKNKKKCHFGDALCVVVILVSLTLTTNKYKSVIDLTRMNGSVELQRYIRTRLSH